MTPALPPRRHTPLPFPFFAGTGYGTYRSRACQEAFWRAPTSPGTYPLQVVTETADLPHALLLLLDAHQTSRSIRPFMAPSSTAFFPLVFPTVTTVQPIIPARIEYSGLQEKREREGEQGKKEKTWELYTSQPTPTPTSTKTIASLSTVTIQQYQQPPTTTTTTTPPPWVLPPDHPRSLTTALRRRPRTALPTLPRRPTSRQARYEPAWTCQSPVPRSSAA